MSYDVFISHSRFNKATADAVCAKLEADGIRCWIAPRDIFGGETWPDAIFRAIQDCRVMVLVFSQAANDSRQVQREISLADGNNLPILPFRIEAIHPTGAAGFYLNDCQWLDALTPPLEAHLAGLSQTVQRNLKRLQEAKAKNKGAMPVGTVPAPVAVLPVAPPPVARNVNPKDGAELIHIPAGPFLMGDDDRRENKRRTVTLSAYSIYKNLVRVGMYGAFCMATGRQMPLAPPFNPNWTKKDHPIVDVSWDDAKAYCDWVGGSLPSEAQWEKAARGTEGRKYPWGDTFDTIKLWCSTAKIGDAGGTTVVGSFPSGASPYGVLDMAGNVWQWCADWFDADFGVSRLAQQPDPVNVSFGEKEYRSLRGGSWNDNSAVIFRCALRGWGTPDDRFLSGFRCIFLPQHSLS